MKLFRLGCFGFAGVLVLLIILTGALGILELPTRFLFGWIFYLWKVLPQVTWSMEMITTSLGSVLLGLLGLRWLMPRLTGRSCQWRWLFACCLLLMLLFATSIAAVGIVHQTAWLIRTPWFETGFTQLRALDNARQVILGCHEYASKHQGQFPDTLKDLFGEGIILDSRVFFGAIDKSASEEPWTYVGAGLRETDKPNFPVLISPSRNRSGQRLVVFLDFRAEFVDEAEVLSALALLRTKELGQK